MKKLEVLFPITFSATCDVIQDFNGKCKCRFWCQDHNGTKSNQGLVGDEFEEVVITGNNLLWVQSGPAGPCEMKDRLRRRSRFLRTIITRREEKIATSQLLHLPHFIFKAHHVVRSHSATVLFWDLSAEHTVIKYFRHLKWTLEWKKPTQDWCLMSHMICLVFDLCIDAASQTAEQTHKQKGSYWEFSLEQWSRVQARFIHVMDTLTGKCFHERFVLFLYHFTTWWCNDAVHLGDFQVKVWC